MRRACDGLGRTRAAACGMRLSSCAMGILAIVFLSGHVAVAQRIAVGIEGGFRTTNDVSGSLTSESKRYIAGPTVDVHLPLRLSLEFDALYRRFGFTGYAQSCCARSITRERVNSWEFPMILKYHPPARMAQPFVGLGYAPRTIRGTDVSSTSRSSTAAHSPRICFGGRRNCSRG